MKWILCLAVSIVGISKVQASCHNFLVGDVTETLWQEAIEAEKDLYALRLTTESMFRDFLSREDLVFNFKDDKGHPISPENFDIEKFKDLVVSMSHPISDFHHFGVSMPLPVRQVEAVSQEELAQQVNSELPREAILNMAHEVAQKILKQIHMNAPVVYANLRELVETNYPPLHVEMKGKEAVEHTDLYEMKAIYREISNYSARLIDQAKRGKRRIGFL